MDKITLDMLVINHACSEQKHLFVKLFGYHADVTEENALVAIENNMQLLWLLYRLGNSDLARDYEDADWVAYNHYIEQVEPFRQAYLDVYNQAAHDYSINSVEFGQTINVAFEVLAEAKKPLFDAYRKTLAKKFVELVKAI